MANKSDVTRIPLDGLLNLNKYRSDIKQFEGFNKKNSPIYGGILSPLYKFEEILLNNNQTTFVNNDEYTLIKEDNICKLHKNSRYGYKNEIARFPIKNITKETIEVPYNILAFERDEDNPNCIDMFVKGTSYYECIRYDTTTETYTNLTFPNISLSKISKVEMRYGFIVFYNFNEQKIYICRKNKNAYKSYNWTWITTNNVIDKLIFTINKLKSSFDYQDTPRYLLSYFGVQYDDVTIHMGHGNRIITLDSSSSGFISNNITIKSTTDNSLQNYQLPTFAIYSNEDDVNFYNIFGGYMEVNNGLFYLRGVADSYDSENNILYITCNNPITLNNNIPSTKKNKIASLDVNPYFYSILIKTNKANNGVDSCLNHHVLFDSTRNYFIGNCGYIPRDNGTKYVPYGFKVNASQSTEDYSFSFLINYGNVTNVSITDNTNQNNIGTLVGEWNFIDNDVTPKVYDSLCLYKISNENTLVMIEIKDENPEMEVLFDRYIVIKTPLNKNILDTQTMSFYHAFVDYNNRVIPCERYGDTSIEKFPYTNADTTPYTLTAELIDYLYTSAINANMEISKINLSSIQYNPSVINQGSYVKFIVENASDDYILNSAVSVYLSDSNQALVPTYYCTFINGVVYKDESLVDIPFPVTTRGNILYSANMFSEIINSYSNRDMIINDTIAYPLLYINNQPSFSFYFLNGIENVNSAFILHGMNYVNTDNFIFSVSYSGDTIGSTEAIVSIKGFRFLGNTTKVAFFYSELKKSVYAFYGDRTLEKVYDCTEINNIRQTFFNPINYNIYITTDDYIYVIDNNTNYRIEIGGTNQMYFGDKFIFIKTETKGYVLMYEKDLTVLKQSYTLDKIPIKLETQLYGVGNNIKSVIDCIYLRLFNNEIVEQGTLTLNVKTLTDKGETTEEKIFNIKASDWDKESNTFYIRYQPKNQECMGMSVNLISDFAIADFDIGHSTDGTIQVSKYNA